MNRFAPKKNAWTLANACLAGACFAAALSSAPTAHALDEAHAEKAELALQKGMAYLLSTQEADGSWSNDYGPAITGLCITPMLDMPNVNADHAAVAKALAYILSNVQEDGSIQAGMLDSYNTAISASALAKAIGNEQAQTAAQNAIAHLKGLQWQEGQEDPQGKIVDAKHPYYGGIGYGKHGRPDMSNLHFMLQAFDDAGVDCNDEAVQRAVAFLNRCQAVDSNDLIDAEVLPRTGGFIYATSINKDNIGVPETKANPDLMDEAKLGKAVSGLRAYGSITYAGFKSYAYAELEQDDPRVLAAKEWIAGNYTIDHNPGMPEDVNQQGYYYYCMTFAKALNAWGDAQIETNAGEKDWANDVIDALLERQQEDGSWVNENASRWMEGNPNLATAYAMIALSHALNH